MFVDNFAHANVGPCSFGLYLCDLTHIWPEWSTQTQISPLNSTQTKTSVFNQVPTSDNLHSQLSQFLISRPSLLQSVLLYQPLWLGELTRDIKEVWILHVGTAYLPTTAGWYKV